MMTGAFDRQNGEASVESYLTSIAPCSRFSAATISVDLSIFDMAGNTQIQVEDMLISSFGPTKREDDSELYLHTVLKLDPEDEILTADWTDPKDARVENGDRVAQYNASQSCHTTIIDTPPASPIISASLHQGCSESILRFQEHMKRVLQQISHRFPRMKILGLTDPSYDLTGHILDGLEDAYLSYRIGNGTEDNLLERLPSLNNNKKISINFFSLSSEIENADSSPGLYDMVILSASTLDDNFNRCDHLSALKQIRNFTKSGGFLIVIHTPVKSTENHTKTTCATKSKSFSSSLLTPPSWPAWLNASDQCHFISRSRNADQHHPLGFSLSIRQAGSKFQHCLLEQAVTMITEHALLIGGQSEGIRAISNGLVDLLESKCTKISTAQGLGDVRPDIAYNCTGAIILADLEDPVCLSLTAKRLENLKHLMRPGMVVLWVTSNARENPCKAASFGLTRSLKAEIPTLVLQVLDLDKQDSCSDLISDAFCQLAQYARLSLSAEPDKVLSAYEPEIHIENGRRIVPRVLPYRPANDRLNAYRRPVSKLASTFNTCILLQPTTAADGFVRYEAQDVGDSRSWYPASPATHLVRVEYSSSQPVSVGLFPEVYICIGRLIKMPATVCVALSPCLASVVQAHVLLTHELSTATIELPRLVSMLAQILFAYDLIEKVDKILVLLEPIQTLRLCVETLLSSTLSKKGAQLEIWSCTEEPEESHNQASRVKHVHPWSTAREVRSCLPKQKCLVYDFLPQGVQLSKTVAALGTHVDYYRHSCIQPVGQAKQDQSLLPSKTLKETWDVVLELVKMGELSDQIVATNIVTTAELLSKATPLPQFTVINWQEDHNIQVNVSPLVKAGVLRDDRTYVLVGLTRDLGQSICRLFIEHGARHIIVASRNPDMRPAWVSELNSAGANIHVHRLDVTVLEDVRQFQEKISSSRSGMPSVGGVVNGAMVLDDRVFVQMEIDTWTRVIGPKTVGSKNLDIIFDSPGLEFFIMLSSFAAIGGHAGQSNYAAANMYMNGLALDRRNRGLAGSVLNIGVIYGIGLLARERHAIYEGLERDGYPPISERDIHHMIIEAIEAGRPVSGQIVDLTTGLARYRVNGSKSLHWHRDPRFCHLTLPEDDEQEGERQPGEHQNQNIRDLIQATDSASAVTTILHMALCRRLETFLNLPVNSVSPDSSIMDIGVDSLVAVDIRDWFYKSSGEDVSVMKILGASSIVTCKLNFGFLIPRVMLIIYYAQCAKRSRRKQRVDFEDREAKGVESQFEWRGGIIVLGHQRLRIDQSRPICEPPFH